MAWDKSTLGVVGYLSDLRDKLRTVLDIVYERERKKLETVKKIAEHCR